MNSTATTLRPLKSSPTPGYEISHLILWCIAFVGVNLAVIGSNSIALSVFFTNRQLLRKRPNHFIICLAATDLLVGLVVMPLYNYQLVSSWRVPDPLVLQDTLYDTFTAMDILAGFASIFTLVSIAVERFCSVVCPLYHRVAPKIFSISLIVTAWILAGLLVVIYFLRKAGTVAQLTFVYLLIFSITISLTLICVFYTVLWHRVKSFGPRRTNSSRRDKRLAVTLIIITVVFAFTWLPFHIVIFVYFFCKSSFCRPSQTLIYMSKLLHYSNSFLNPIVYSFRNQNFRQSLKRLLTCRKVAHREKRNRTDQQYWKRVQRANKGSLDRQPAYRRKNHSKIVFQL